MGKINIPWYCPAIIKKILPGQYATFECPHSNGIYTRLSVLLDLTSWIRWDQTWWNLSVMTCLLYASEILIFYFSCHCCSRQCHFSLSMLSIILIISNYNKTDLLVMIFMVHQSHLLKHLSIFLEIFLHSLTAIPQQSCTFS